MTPNAVCVNNQCQTSPFACNTRESSQEVRPARAARMCRGPQIFWGVPARARARACHFSTIDRYRLVGGSIGFPPAVPGCARPTGRRCHGRGRMRQPIRPLHARVGLPARAAASAARAAGGGAGPLCRAALGRAKPPDLPLAGLLPGRRRPTRPGRASSTATGGQGRRCCQRRAATAIGAATGASPQTHPRHASQTLSRVCRSKPMHGVACLTRYGRVRRAQPPAPVRVTARTARLTVTCGHVPGREPGGSIRLSRFAHPVALQRPYDLKCRPRPRLRLYGGRPPTTAEVARRPA